MPANNSPKITRTSWFGKDAVRLCTGAYEALIVPEEGGNLIELKNNLLKANILRTPSSIDKYDSAFLFGIPVLFPPNRIKEGKFTYRNKNYQFPVNETERGNHLHGFLYNQKWTVSRETITDTSCEVELSFIADKNTDFYKYFPHQFIIKLVHNLSKDGLHQTVQIINTGISTMPAGFGYHTTFNIPFNNKGNSKNCFLKLSTDGRWELGKGMLPTGNNLGLNEWESAFRNKGVACMEHPFDTHYRKKSISFKSMDFNGAIIEDTSAGLRLVYEAGNSFKHWMVYNGLEERKDFICPEPQTWLVNTPNIDMPAKVTGLIELDPGKNWSDYTRIYVEKII